jgi:nucleoredoxin
MKTNPNPLLILSIILGILSPFSARADFFGKLEPQLIQVVDGKKADYKKPAKSPKYTAIYYSAHWCPPCRAFTPKLVEWYKEFKPKHENFELVFASSDKNEEAQIEYMKEMGMPWPAMKFAAAKDPLVKKYSASGIPYIVLIDEAGKDMTGQKDNEWQSPQGVLPKIEEIVGGKK